MIAPRWFMHAFAVRPKTAPVVIGHLTDEYGAPWCGGEAGERTAELGTAAHPGGYSTLACVECLILSNPKEPI